MQTESNTKQITFVFIAEVKLNLFKVNVNREQYKTNRICFYGRGEAETLGNIQVQQTDIKQNTANEPAKGMLLHDETRPFAA